MHNRRQKGKQAKYDHRRRQPGEKPSFGEGLYSGPCDGLIDCCGHNACSGDRNQFKQLRIVKIRRGVDFQLLNRHYEMQSDGHRRAGGQSKTALGNHLLSHAACTIDPALSGSAYLGADQFDGQAVDVRGPKGPVSVKWRGCESETARPNLINLVRCRCDRSRQSEASVCSRGIAQSSERSRRRAESESAPVRRPPHDRDAHKSVSDRAGLDCQYLPLKELLHHAQDHLLPCRRDQG